ncbi:MAG: hypothetical protein M3O30_07560 [Planctomycetota bacterium]|nr:hypothetical protein [Planctomycetota bacterium]
MTQRKSMWVMASSVALLLAFFFQPALAARKGGKGRSSNPGGNAPPAPPSPASIQLNQDRTAQSDAQAAYSKAAAAVEQATTKLRLAYEATSEWIAAQKQLADAQSALEEARKPVIADLAANNADYAEAVSARDKAQANLDEVKSSPQNATPEVLTPLATEVMQASAKIGKMESDALGVNANYLAAKDGVASALAAINQLKVKFQESLASDADWKAAKDAADTAHQTLLDAQAKVAVDQGRSVPPTGVAGAATGNTAATAGDSSATNTPGDNSN